MQEQLPGGGLLLVAADAVTCWWATNTAQHSRPVAPHHQRMWHLGRVTLTLARAGLGRRRPAGALIHSSAKPTRSRNCVAISGHLQTPEENKYKYKSVKFAKIQPTNIYYVLVRNRFIRLLPCEERRISQKRSLPLDHVKPEKQHTSVRLFLLWPWWNMQLASQNLVKTLWPS